eukprot:scaffold10167_cov275-Chaetoceros_neogracile.AAC.3
MTIGFVIQSIRDTMRRKLMRHSIITSFDPSKTIVVPRGALEIKPNALPRTDKALMRNGAHEHNQKER